MKKFLVYLCVIIVAVSTGFAVFFLVRDNEVISLTTTSLYKDVGAKFELSLNISDPNSYTTISLESSNSEVLDIVNEEISVKDEVAKASFVAKTGGVSRVNFKTNNSKFRNLYCDVVIGDGSVNYPFHISTAEQLNKIGKTIEGQENPYTLASCYELVADIDMAELDGTWIPLGTDGETPFTGIFDGNGHYINNLNINNINANNVGIFGSIGQGGVVKNVKLVNGELHTSANNKYVGLIAGLNQGVVERIEIQGLKVYNEIDDIYIGSVVGYNQSLNNSTQRTIAKVDRVSAVVDFFATPASVDLETGNIITEANTEVKGNIGGLVGYNKGGLVRFSYANGNINVTNGATFGGIINKNEYAPITSGGQYSEDLGANVKDCYSAVVVTSELTSANIAGLIFSNISVNDINTIWGNYYDASRIPATCVGINGMANAEYVCMGKNSNELKTITLPSHQEYAYAIENGVLTQTPTSVVYWNSQVWLIDGTNEGYPVINYAEQDIADEKEITDNMVVVTTREQLISALSKLDATVIINADIDLSVSEWVPIGTETAPFAGYLSVSINPETGEPYKITGLKINSTSYKHAGFFGVISNARVENLILVNPQILNNNHAYAGAIAGANGYKESKIQGGSIVNCSVLGGDISADVAAGAIVGQNNGIIVNPAALGTFDRNELNALNIIATTSKSASVGGVAGVNYTTITTNYNNLAVVKGCVNITASDEGAGTIYAGGIAGKNEGNIHNSFIKINYGDSNNSYGINVPNKYKAQVGGVAGYSTGSVDVAYVSARIIAGSTNSENYAGGAVGYLLAKNNSDAINVSGVYVYESYIRSANVGGLVGYLAGSDRVVVFYNTSNWISRFYSEVITVSDKYYTQDALVANISASSVQDTVSLYGNYVAGLVTEIQRGFVTDCYSIAQLGGTNSAGMVYTINYNKVNSTGGVVTRCYTIATFVGGTNKFAVTSSNIHSQNNIEKRTVGFIDDYYFAKTSKDGKEPAYFTKVVPEVINWFKSDENHVVTHDRDIETLKKSEIWNSFAQENVTTGQNPWNIKNGVIPTLDVDNAFVNISKDL